MKTQQGFTLIELMITISIISILAMLAVPSYQQYTQRARFTEIISTANIYKTAVSLALQEGTSMNEINNDTAGIPSQPKPSKNMASLNIERGVITAAATQAAGSATYILKPSPDGSSWAVGGTCLQLGFCRG